MAAFLAKTLFSALVIAGVSEIARRSSFWAAIVIALPLTTVLTLIWLWRDTGDVVKVTQLSTGVFWLVLSTLPFFLLLPVLLKAQWNFYLSMLASLALSTITGVLLTQVLKRFGVTL